MTRYFRFWEPKTLEAWKCWQARVHGKMARVSLTIRSNSVTVSGKMNVDINCEAGVINFPYRKTIWGWTAQELYGTTLSEEFAMTITITLCSWIQTRVADKSLVDNLEVTMTCSMTWWQMSCIAHVCRINGEGSRRARGGVGPTSCNMGRLTCSMGLEWMGIHIHTSKGHYYYFFPLQVKQTAWMSVTSLSC
jgi:hypothetical protein